MVNEEIAELRRKLARLGSVNLDSLQELSELESRAQNLQTQFDDLTLAKKSLEEIINTINQDSRRLFTETFAAIRTHFQELFFSFYSGMNFIRLDFSLCAGEMTYIHFNKLSIFCEHADGLLRRCFFPGNEFEKEQCRLQTVS